MLNKEKTTKTISQVELKRKNFKWEGRGIKISSVIDMELKFGIHMIAHKIYSSSHLNSVSCEVVDLALKMAKTTCPSTLLS